MKNNLTQPRIKSQRGIGLIEVMISLAIGLVLLGALAYFFIANQQINRTHDDVSRMQESGRNAMEILGKAIRQAGYRLDVDQPLYVDTVKNIYSIIGTNNSGTGAAALPDTITIRHDPKWAPSTTNPIYGSEVDCLGNTVVSNNDTFDSYGNRNINSAVVEYGFRIKYDANIPYLYCSNTANNPATGGTAIVDNIENMQIQYGIIDGTGAITKYIDEPTNAEFAQVAAVRVSLLVRGPSSNIATYSAKNIADDIWPEYTYNKEKVKNKDGYLRQVYTSTFTVRNQAR